MAGTFGAGTIRVCCRARPLLPSERALNEKCIVSSNGTKNLVVFPPSFSNQANGTAGARMNTTLSRSFEFDLACDETFDQNGIFEECGAKSMVDASLEGVKATIMAYGATSSGKTYTMSGLDESSGGRDAAGTGAQRPTDAHEGLILKSARYLFDRIKAREGDNRGEYEITASYLEIYNEQVFDLLNLTGRPLGVRHQPTTDEFYVPGLLEVRCENLGDLGAVLEEGHANRRRAGHELNQDSSRSHSLLIIHVVCDMTKQFAATSSGRGGGMKKFGKLVFVDLAGSERLKKSKSNDPEETGAINKSLFTLAKVISLLADLSERSSTAHVPYRDSVLTKLLSDALGGNALALFLACISPSDNRCEETLATLHYANRARSIKNRPTVVMEGGIQSPENELAMLRNEVLQLRADKNRLEAENVSLREELSLANNQDGLGGGLDSSGFSLNFNGSFSEGALKGGRPRQVDKSPLSTDGGGIKGRPPPGAAGRGLREAHEKAKGFQSEVRRLEISLAASIKNENQAKREIHGLKTQLEQLQNATAALNGGDASNNGGGSGASASDGKGGANNQMMLVASQREVNHLKAAFQKMKSEKASIVAEYGEFVGKKAELEEKVVVAERSLQQMENHNLELQHQLREREEQIQQLQSGSSPIPSEKYPHLKNSYEHDQQILQHQITAQHSNHTPLK